MSVSKRCVNRLFVKAFWIVDCCRDSLLLKYFREFISLRYTDGILRIDMGIARKDSGRDACIPK